MVHCIPRLDRQSERGQNGLDAQPAGTLPVYTNARVSLRIACPNCANICRVEHDAMAIGLH